ncbi:MAG: chemotaxis protein CheY [Gemmatimonas sp. SG8_38_2]|nr:MAG: chemotaxis protein CheY [Gemmatimonas sp. SG8_38_2]
MSFRVVLIDDDPDLRKLVKLTLEFTAGWEVTTAEGGMEGIEAVRQLRPDVAVVDFMMPGMDGYEVCRKLKEDPETADIPLIFLTARKELDRLKVEEVGAVGVVVKPFDPDQLARQLLELCGGGGR